MDANFAWIRRGDPTGGESLDGHLNLCRKEMIGAGGAVSQSVADRYIPSTSARWMMNILHGHDFFQERPLVAREYVNCLHSSLVGYSVVCRADD